VENVSIRKKFDEELYQRKYEEI